MSVSATAKLTVPKLLKMSQNELDDLYTNSPSGDIPDGDCEGTIIVAPGTVITPIKAKLMHLFGWQGKVFDKKKGRLVNKILPLGHHAIRAEVYKDKSWYDGKECIAIDYSKTSLVANWIRWSHSMARSACFAPTQESVWRAA